MLDSSLWEEGAAHAGHSLPVGQHAGTVQFRLRQACSLLDELGEHLEAEF